MTRPFSVALALLFAFFLAFPEAGAASEISDLAVHLDGDRVLVDLEVTGAFDSALLERVASGLPTTLVFELELMRDRKRWFDRGLGKSSLTVVGIYDALRREYLVNYKLDGRLLETRMVHDLPGLRGAMSRIEGLPAFSLDGVDPEGRRLLVRARVALGYRHLMGFIPSRITTDWVESRKFRPTRNPGR